MRLIEFDRELRLTKNFYLSEFLVSDQHAELIDSIKLGEDYILKLYYLSVFCLEKVREKFGEVKVLSGYRTIKLNKSIGGTNGSQHCHAEACDFFCPEKNMKEVYDFLVMEIEWPGEVIYYPGKNMIHVSLPRLGMKVNQFIKPLEVKNV